MHLFKVHMYAKLFDTFYPLLFLVERISLISSQPIYLSVMGGNGFD